MRAGPEADMTRKIAALSVATSLCLIGSALTAPAQRAADNVQVRKLDVKKFPTPQYQLSSSQMKGKSRDWVGITSEYDTDAEWTDELTFTYYVLLRGKDPKGPRQSLLRGKVTYVNIEAGRGHKSDVYLHPSTLARFGDVEMVAVLIEANGRLLAGESLPKAKVRWWEQMSPQDGLVLNRMQTPFAMINFDDYEAVKPAAP